MLVECIFNISKMGGAVVALELALSQLGSSCCSNNHPRFELSISNVSRLVIQYSAVFVAFAGSMLTVISNSDNAFQRACGTSLPFLGASVLLVVHPVQSDIIHRPLCEGSSMAVIAMRTTRAIAFMLCFQVGLICELSKMKTHALLARHDVSMRLLVLSTSCGMFVLISPFTAIPVLVVVFVLCVCFRGNIWIRLLNKPIDALACKPLDIIERDEEIDIKHAAPPQPSPSTSEAQPLLVPVSTTTQIAPQIFRLRQLGVHTLSAEDAKSVMNFTN